MQCSDIVLPFKAVRRDDILRVSCRLRLIQQEIMMPQTAVVCHSDSREDASKMSECSNAVLPIRSAAVVHQSRPSRDRACRSFEEESEAEFVGVAHLECRRAPRSSIESMTSLLYRFQYFVARTWTSRVVPPRIREADSLMFGVDHAVNLESNKYT